MYQVGEGIQTKDLLPALYELPKAWIASQKQTRRFLLNFHHEINAPGPNTPLTQYRHASQEAKLGKRGF